MTGFQLVQSIYQSTFQGQLTSQLESDSSAIALLDLIRKEKSRLDTLRLIPKKPFVKPVSSNEEPPFSVPSNWAWARLAEVSLIQEGAGIRKHQYQTSGIQLLTVTNILDGAIDMSKHKIFIKEDEYKQKYSQLTLKKGDIVCACSGGSWGKSAIFDQDGTFMLNTSTLRLRFFGDIGDNHYLYYLTKSSLFKDQLKDQLSGMQPNFGYAHYSNILIPIPPIEEQRRIVSKLNEILPAVEEYDKAAGELETLNKILPDKLRKSVLQEAIHGNLVPNDIPDREATGAELLQQILKERQEKENKEKGKKAKKLTLSTIEEEPWDLPEGWCWCSVKDFCDVIGGFAFPSQDLKSSTGKRVIRISDVTETGLSDSRIVRYGGNASLESYEIKTGDILMAMTGGTVGKSLLLSFLPEPLLLNQRVAAIRNQYFNVKYLDLVLKSPLTKEVIEMAKNSTNDNISMADINGFMIPLPPLSIQHRIVDKIEEVFATIDKLQA